MAESLPFDSDNDLGQFETMADHEKNAEHDPLMGDNTNTAEPSFDETSLDGVGDRAEAQNTESSETIEGSETDLLMAQLEKTVTERDEFKTMLQRERADFVNFRKRVEREKSESRNTYVASTVTKFLPVLDDFDRAMASVPSEVGENGWVEGFALIHKKFNDLLNQLGVVPIDPLGQPFDPNLHEAVGSEDSEQFESGTVSTVLQKGYMLDDKCIRVAMVKVAN